MMLKLLALALAVAHAAASVSDLACSLNGAMAGSACKCDAPWKGSSCSKLDIVPKKKGSLPAYGFAPNVSSWGGNAIQNDAGTYDMWVSEMVNGCGLKDWGKNSRIIHATAANPNSAFKFQEATLPVWAHNAAPVRAPKTHTACPGCYYLFHIGSGNGGSPVKCDNMTTPHTAPLAASGGWSSLVHRAKTPAGPWEPLPSIPKTGCNNPAPAFAKNGTLYVLCSSSSIWRSSEPTSAAAWQKVVSVNLNDSPWTGGKPSPFLKVEDPYLYQDKNGNWHLLVHLYDYRDGWPVNPNQTMPVLVSGHAYSMDLTTWGYSVEKGKGLGESQPFDPTVVYDDGSVQHYSTFERPHLIFNSAGVPTHTVHGASPVWDQYGAHHPCEVCPARPGTQHSCVVCKSSTDYSWTYTLVQELNVGVE